MHVLCEVIQGYIPAHSFLQGKLFCVSGNRVLYRDLGCLILLEIFTRENVDVRRWRNISAVAGPCVLEARHLLSVGQTHSRGEDTGNEKTDLNARSSSRSPDILSRER